MAVRAPLHPQTSNPQLETPLCSLHPARYAQQSEAPQLRVLPHGHPLGPHSRAMVCPLEDEAHAGPGSGFRAMWPGNSKFLGTHSVV